MLVLYIAAQLTDIDVRYFHPSLSRQDQFIALPAFERLRYGFKLELTFNSTLSVLPSF